ncbi:hypothetical protein ACWEJ6_50965 [Nonomuraea sp. NPDC004702]
MSVDDPAGWSNDPKNSPALAAAARAATDRYRGWMDQLDAQINEQAQSPTASVSIAACVAVAAQLALGHAVELMSVLHGQDLEAEAGKLVEAEWDGVRLDVARQSCARSVRSGFGVAEPADLTDMLQESDLDERVPQSASLALAAMLAAGLAHAQIEPERWPLPEMARQVARQALQAATADQGDDTIAQWFASLGPATSR